MTATKAKTINILTAIAKKPTKPMSIFSSVITNAMTTSKLPIIDAPFKNINIAKLLAKNSEPKYLSSFRNANGRQNPHRLYSQLHYNAIASEQNLPKARGQTNASLRLWA